MKQAHSILLVGDEENLPLFYSPTGAERLKQQINILVVDDEPLMTDSLKRILGVEGYRVQTAQSFGEGAAALERVPFDLVISDLQLPDDPQGGLALLRAVKAQQACGTRR